MEKNEFALKLQKILSKRNLNINNIDYYYEAFTHPSYANENNVPHYERLEFLGDAILGFLVADFLYHYKKSDEGDMTKMRSIYVCTQANAKYTLELGLEDCLLLGKGAKEHNDESTSVLADLFEAFLGALYLDHNLEYVRRFLNEFLFKKIKEHRNIEFHDYKSKLQEYIQAESRQTLRYVVIKESGPPHNKTFEVAVMHDYIRLGVGKGKTKKEAEQNAAKKALELMAR